jgi:uncharacterized protein (TIRG00374 family)
MKKSTLSLLIGLVIGLILIFLFIRSIDFSFLVTSLRSIAPLYIVAAGVFYIAAYWFRSIRWNLLLRQQIRLKVKETWLISSAGNWLNYLIPIRAGEFAKAILIKRLKQKSAVSVLPSVFIDKFFDTLGIFFVLLLIPLLRIHISKGLQILLALLILIFILVFGILILAATHKKSITGILQVVFAWLPGKVRIKINELIELFINGLNIFEHHHSIILYSVLLTAVGILMDGLYFFCVFRAFHQDLNFLIILFGYTLINLSYVLPQPPAQLGSNEWMMIIIFSLGFGFDKNIASSIMVFAHVFTACVITILGIIGFSYAGVKSAKQIQKEL